MKDHEKFKNMKDKFKFFLKNLGVKNGKKKDKAKKIEKG